MVMARPREEPRINILKLMRGKRKTKNGLGRKSVGEQLKHWIAASLAQCCFVSLRRDYSCVFLWVSAGSHSFTPPNWA